MSTKSTRPDVEIDVFLSGDQNVYIGILVASTSFLNKLSRTIPHFKIVHRDFSKDQQEDLIKSLKSTGKEFELDFIRADSIDYKGLSLDGYASTAYAKFLIPEYSEFTWSVYLDCDIVVTGDFSQILSNLDARCSLYAVTNYPTRRFSDQIGVNFDSFGIEATKPYFNSGMLIVQNEAWRKQEIAKRTFDILSKHKFPTYDQDVLNIVLYDRWKDIPNDWNFQLYEDRSPLPSNKAIHYSGKTKPWHCGYDRKKGEAFWDALSKTRLCDWRPKFDIYHWLRNTRAKPILEKFKYNTRKLFGLSPIKKRGT